MRELLVAPGETVPVGTVLASLLAPGETAETAAPIVEAEGAKPPVAAPPPQRRRISPAARKRAEELGVDVARLAGSGPDGAISLQDVERAGTVKAPPEERAAQMRKAIATAMSRSKREIPHYYLSETVVLERAAAWLEAENAARPVTGRLLMAVLFLKAVALACVRYPEMNGYYRDGGFQSSAAVHAGVAISLRQGGLVAPAIHDVQRKELGQLMRDLADLVQRARAGSLRSSEMSDPTITITNLGDQGVESLFGVIYPPQVALVGFGRILERPWAEQGALRVLPAVTVSVSADHRVSDGHRGALFLSEIRALLQTPESL